MHKASARQRRPGRRRRHCRAGRAGRAPLSCMLIKDARARWPRPTSTWPTTTCGWTRRLARTTPHTCVRARWPLAFRCLPSADANLNSKFVAQVKPGKIDPYFHAMGASALLSFGAMYPYALGAASSFLAFARVRFAAVLLLR